MTKEGAALTGLSGKKEEGRMDGKQGTGSGVGKGVSDGIRGSKKPGEEGEHDQNMHVCISISKNK